MTKLLQKLFHRRPPSGESTGPQGSVQTAFGLSQIPGFAPPLPGTYAVYRRMSAHPTLALARSIVTAPILAGTWAFEMRRPDGQKVRKAPIGEGVAAGAGRGVPPRARARTPWTRPRPRAVGVARTPWDAPASGPPPSYPRPPNACQRRFPERGRPLESVAPYRSATRHPLRDQSAEAQANRGAVRLGQDHRWACPADAARHVDRFHAYHAVPE